MSGPAGWFQDPFDPRRHRYWDGEQWTEHVSLLGVQGIDPPVARPVGPAPVSGPLPTPLIPPPVPVLVQPKRRRGWRMATRVAMVVGGLFVGLVALGAILTAAGVDSQSQKRTDPTATPATTEAVVVRPVDDASRSTTSPAPETTVAAVVPTTVATTVAPTAKLTTTVPRTAAPAPSTTVAPAEGVPCPKVQERRGGLVCATTSGAPLWLNAPFSRSRDKVSVLGDSVDNAAHVQIQDMAVGALRLTEASALGQEYWCISVVLKNFSKNIDTYNLFDFRLLTPTGNLVSPTLPLFSDQSSVLQSGELATNGSVTGAVCFDRPRATTGRFALVYSPLSFTSDARGLFYFDR